MKNIILISSVILLFVGSQICGCGSCSQAKAQSPVSSQVVKATPETVTLKITGMTCAGCSNHVTKALESIQGVSKVDLKYPGDVATIQFDASKTNIEELIAAIVKINYKAEEVKDPKRAPMIKK